MTPHRNPPSDSFIGLVLLGLSLAALILRHTGRRVARGIVNLG